MTNSPMREAAKVAVKLQSKTGCSWHNAMIAQSVALDRMDRWAGQVAAVMSSPAHIEHMMQSARGKGCDTAAEFIAMCAYDMAEALERERTKRMTGK